RFERPVREYPPRPAPVKRTGSPPFLRGRRRFPVPTKALAVRVEDAAHPAGPVSYQPPHTLVQAPPRSAETRYSNQAYAFPTTRGSAAAGPPKEVPTNASPVETRLAASQQRHHPGSESPDAFAPSAPPRLAQSPTVRPCVRSRPRQILPRSSAA